MLTHRLAAWVAGMAPGQVPGEVRRELRLLSLDTFGCALSGATQPWSRVIRDWALEGAIDRAPSSRPGSSAGAGLARVWGDAVARLRPSDAALVNGAAAHAFEVDDFHNAKVHLGAVVLSAALAVGEAVGATTAWIETAVAVGYEVIIRSSLSLTPARARMRGWHLTSVCGPLGAAAAAAVLLRLDAQRTAWALGLAGTQACGLYAFTADGTDSKRLHPGRAAQAGVMAAELAARGLSGPTQVYEAADGGLLSTFTDQPDPDQLLDRLGEHWHAPATNFKPYGCCGSAHAHVDAALALRPHWRPGMPVRVGVPAVVDMQCGYPYVAGSALNAQMSLRYAVAVALLKGDVLPAQFEASVLNDPAVARLANALEISRDAALDAQYPAHFCGWVELLDPEGRGQRHTVMDPSGSVANPGRAQAIRAKFESLTSPWLDAPARTRIAQAWDRFDQIELATLLQAATGRAS